MNTGITIKLFYKKINLFLLFLILFAFLFTFAHSFIHNSFDHLHDTSCSVYVLEEFFTSADTPNIQVVFLLFIPYLLVSYLYKCYFDTHTRIDSIRAPPFSCFIS